MHEGRTGRRALLFSGWIGLRHRAVTAIFYACSVLARRCARQDRGAGPAGTSGVLRFWHYLFDRWIYVLRSKLANANLRSQLRSIRHAESRHHPDLHRSGSRQETIYDAARRTNKQPFAHLSKEFTSDLPILAWLIAHPEGDILIDAGLSGGLLRPGYPDSPALFDAWLTRQLCGFALKPGEQIGKQLPLICPSGTRGLRVVMTHLHIDHVDGLSELSGCEILVNEAEWAHPSGRQKHCSHL